MRRKILILGLLLTAFSLSTMGCGKKEDNGKDTTEKLQRLQQKKRTRRIQTLLIQRMTRPVMTA
ncbi:MAG: hypothetical protein ACI4D8_02485 [Wujia sp.]